MPFSSKKEFKAKPSGRAIKKPCAFWGVVLKRRYGVQLDVPTWRLAAYTTVLESHPP